MRSGTLAALRLRATFVHRAWRYRLKLDPDEVRWMRSVLRPGDFVIDAGAHKGGYSYWMRRSVGANGRVIAFEPQPTLAAVLSRSVDVLGWDNVRVENMGLSAEPGEATLHVPGDGPSPGATMETNGSDVESTDLRVSVDSLDHYLAAQGSRPPVRFIKCDVEGHELQVFRGARRILESDRPLLLFECEARHNPGRTVSEVFDFLSGLGYAGHFFSDGDLVGLDRFDPSLHQVVGTRPYVHNFVFKPA